MHAKAHGKESSSVQSPMLVLRHGHGLDLAIGGHLSHGTDVIMVPSRGPSGEGDSS